MKNKTSAIWFILSLFLSTSVYACGIGEMVDGYENASVQHAYEHWRAGDRSPIPFLFIDVRTPEEYASGHVKGAKLIPLQQLQQRLAEVPKEKRVYVYCHSGRRSAAAARMLAGAGFSNIENIMGGITAWQAAGYPTVR